MIKRKSVLKEKNFLIYTVLIISVAGTGFYFLLDKSTKRQNLSVAPKETGVVIYPTLYSDEHITTNAITSDPRFKNLVMSEVKSDGKDLSANVSDSIQANKPAPGSKGQEAGTWLWTPPFRITPKYRDSIISGALRNNIRSIYLSIDTYLDIFVLNDGPEKDKMKKDFTGILEDFIKEAHKNNIAVDAEAGWRNWAEDGNTYKAFAVLDYVLEFNKTHTEKFRGFQYDVEPYMLQSYRKDKKTALYNFVNLIGDTVTRLDKENLELSVVIPEFYDSTNGETPEFSYGGKSGYTLDHLLDVLENRPGSKIIVMSYRNFTTGYDGSIDISKDEISEANKYRTKIIIAQETGDVPPPYITFHNTSRLYYQKQIQTIEKTFAKSKSFGGIAVHYINTLMELK